MDGILDRVARLALPPLSSLGAPGTVLAPLALVLIVSLATTGLVHASGWELAGSPAPPERLRPWLWALAALAPVLALAKGAVLAIVAWALLTLLGSEASYRRALSALLYGEAILSLQAPALLATLLLQGGVRAGPVPVPTGLDAFVDPARPVLLALARGVTPFHILWIAFVALALASASRASRAHGLLTGVSLWLLLTGLGVLRAFLGQGSA